ncbi:MAG: hypothetical protein E7352_00610 [Clostridiales bacterium]|nr:hypothetical protein [Clostridiales bacterium]
MFEKKKVILVVSDDVAIAKFAVSIVQQGASNILLIGNNQDFLDDVFAQVRKVGGQVSVRKCNPADLGATLILSNELKEEYGVFDYLINATEFEFINMIPAKIKMRTYTKGAYTVMWATDTQR